MHCAVPSAADKLILLFYHRVFLFAFLLLLRHKQKMNACADCRILADTEPIDFQDFLRQVLPFPVDPRGETRLLVPNATDLLFA